MLDHEVYDGVLALLGREAALRLVGDFAVELRARLAGIETGADRLGLREDAHALVSSAGMLGFAALAAACRDTEEACVASRAPDAVRARLAREREAALATIARLTAA